MQLGNAFRSRDFLASIHGEPKKHAKEERPPFSREKALFALGEIEFQLRRHLPPTAVNHLATLVDLGSALIDACDSRPCSARSQANDESQEHTQMDLNLDEYLLEQSMQQYTSPQHTQGSDSDPDATLFTYF